MLYTTQDYDPEADDQLAAPPSTVLSLSNEFSAIDQQNIDKTMPVESRKAENTSIMVELNEDSVVFSVAQDALFKATGSDDEVMEAVVDVSKFPAKNDL